MRPKNIKLTLYLAAPLFSKSELDYNFKLAAKLQKYFNIFLPQRDGGLMLQYIKSGMSVQEASRVVFDIDIDAIDKSDVVLAILDGRTVDEGVAVEVGYAYAKKIPCIGFQTDPRRLLPVGNNPMVTNVLEVIFQDEKSLLSWAASGCGFRRTSPDSPLDDFRVSDCNTLSSK